MMMTPPQPVIWSRCELCAMPVALFDADELAYLMSIHNGSAHIVCPTEADLERIMTHGNPSADNPANRRLAGRPQQLIFTTQRGPRG